MEKRLIVTIALCMLVLLAWSAFVSKTQPVVNQGFTSKAAQQVNTVQQAVNEPSAPLKKSLPQLHEKIKLFNEEIDFSVTDASINEVLFKEHKNYTFLLKDSFLIDDKNLDFKVASSGSNFITFIHIDATKRVTKRFEFSKSRYATMLQLTIENISNAPLKISFPIIIGTFFLMQIQVLYFILPQSKALRAP